MEVDFTQYIARQDCEVTNLILTGHGEDSSHKSAGSASEHARRAIRRFWDILSLQIARFCSKLLSRCFRVLLNVINKGGVRGDVVPCQKVPEAVKSVMRKSVLEKILAFLENH